MVVAGPSCIVKNHIPFKVHLEDGRVFRRNNNSFESFVESPFEDEGEGGCDSEEW